MTSALRLVFGIESEVNQRAVLLAGLHHHVAASSAVATAGSSPRHKLLPAKCHATVATGSGCNPNSRFVDEHRCLRSAQPSYFTTSGAGSLDAKCRKKIDRYISMYRAHRFRFTRKFLTMRTHDANSRAKNNASQKLFLCTMLAEAQFIRRSRLLPAHCLRFRLQIANPLRTHAASIRSST